MRIAIVNLTGGGFSGGYKKYLKNMIPRLANHRDVCALLCVYPEGSLVMRSLEKQQVTEYCTCKALHFNHLFYIPDHNMKECLRKFRPDVIFIPNARYINYEKVPVVNMLQNMEPFAPFFEGDTIRERCKKTVQRNLSCCSMKYANRTIAISKFVRDFLINVLRVPANKISQIYHGVTTHTHEPCVRPAQIPTGWDGNFLFACGSVRPARGLEDVLNALAILKSRNIEVRLVIAGETAPGMRKYISVLEQLVLSRGIKDNICWAGDLSESEVQWCYRMCSLFVMTSRIEACPNTALEAMSNGCVSISTRSSPLPEIFGDAAVYYSPKNEKDLSTIIENVLSWDDRLRNEYSKKAMIRAANYSWDICVEKILKTLKSACMDGLKKESS